MEFDFIKRKNEIEDEEVSVLKYLPENIYFGFSEGLNKRSLKDVRTMIDNYVKDNFSSKRRSFFKIEKIKNHNYLPDGYFFEIQEGGYGISFSKRLIEEFNDEKNNSLLLQIKNRYVFIVRQLNNVETNYTSTNEITENQREYLLETPDDEIMERLKKPDMNKVFDDKFVFLIISQLMLVSSLITIAIAAFLKFGYFQMEDKREEYVDYSGVPIEEIYNLESTLYKRVQRIAFNGTEGWYVIYEYRDIISEEEGYIEYGEYMEDKEILRPISTIKERERERSRSGSR